MSHSVKKTHFPWFGDRNSHNKVSVDEILNQIRVRFIHLFLLNGTVNCYNCQKDPAVTMWIPHSTVSGTKRLCWYLWGQEKYLWALLLLLALLIPHLSFCTLVSVTIRISWQFKKSGNLVTITSLFISIPMEIFLSIKNFLVDILIEEDQ